MKLNNDNITIHNQKEEFEGMRKVGRLSASILDAVKGIIAEGITTNEINDFCHKMTIEAGATPAPLGYRNPYPEGPDFPKSICTSVNHVVCHGVPNDTPLKSGDIVNIDITSLLDGWHGDTSRMFTVGKVKPLAKRLIKVTYDAMMKGIEQVKPGATIGDIGYAIQNYVEKQKFSVVKDYCGHGVGQVFHAPPNILHYGKKGEGLILEEGMFFTIEPMVNVGRADTILSKHDYWTVTTRDKKLSAQFEHSLAVTKDGFEIFTL